MTKTELLDRLAGDGEERLLLARTLDQMELCRRRSIPTHTGFLSPGERAAAERLTAAAGGGRSFFFGGWREAERTVCVFLPDWMEEEDWTAGTDCPVTAIRCVYRAEDRPNHRDFLGAVLGQGISREKVGDILVGDGQCDILALREITPYLIQNLDSAGRTRLKVREISLGEVSAPAGRREEVTATVAAARLDAVLAAAFHLSRSKAAELISSGRVTVGYRECIKPDKSVAAGDALSCRGMGKCVLKEIVGTSRKGRTVIRLERYL